MHVVERDFWAALEYRVCSEFQGFADHCLRLWCDGLVPEQYDLQGEQPCIRGRAYCGPDGQQRWRFTLLVGAEVSVAEDIDWASLLPGDDVTGWLSPHLRDRVMVIDPLAAHPDH